MKRSYLAAAGDRRARRHRRPWRPSPRPSRPTSPPRSPIRTGPQADTRPRCAAQAGRGAGVRRREARRAGAGADPGRRLLHPHPLRRGRARPATSPRRLPHLTGGGRRRQKPPTASPPIRTSATSPRRTSAPARLRQGSAPVDLVWTSQNYHDLHLTRCSLRHGRLRQGGLHGAEARRRLLHRGPRRQGRHRRRATPTRCTGSTRRW